MATRDVRVVRTGTANLASVLAGLSRAGAEARLTEDPEEVRRADRLVLPGVGAFGAAAARLRERGLYEALRDRVAQRRPLLAICLGMQLLAEGSEESPGVSGLAVVPGIARRFPRGVRIPQLGWNHVEPETGSLWIAPGFAYFAHSYRLVAAPEGWRAAHSDHGGRFLAALEGEGVLACQFHPELSGSWGLALLRRWLDGRCGGPETGVPTPAGRALGFEDRRC